jgi:spermidine synthase
MKPRIKLAEALSAQGEAIELYAHDESFLMHWHGSRLLTNATRDVEAALAGLGCSPFRSVGQPRILIAGLGLGHLAAGALAALSQKRGQFVVAEATAAVVDWNRGVLDALHPGMMDDKRLSVENRPVEQVLAREHGAWHAILVHLDLAPPPRSGKGEHLLASLQDLRLAAAALKDGGLLTLGAARRMPGLTRKLVTAGFSVAEHEIPLSSSSKRPRFHHVWLARRGVYAKTQPAG